MMQSNGNSELERPIIILGVPRSGTTLLSFMLDSHPNIAIGRETYFMKGVEHLFGDSNDNDPQHIEYVRRGWYERYGLKREEFANYIRRFLYEFYSDYARKQNKIRWGDKTPAHTLHCELMYEIFPDAQFIHIVRDPRAVVLSRSRWKTSSTIEDIASEWQRENDRVANLGSRLASGSYLRIHYEDLVLHSELTMKKVLSFLGEEWCESVLSHEEVETHKYVSCQHEGVTSPRVRVIESKAVVEGGPENDPARKIDTDSLDKWKMKLRKMEIASIQKIAAKGMRNYGYPFATGLIPLIGKVRVEEYKCRGAGNPCA